ncbi:MAG: YraN family protein [Acidimicrobiales bacterium]
MVSRRQQLGAEGEARVADHYEARGYTVLERNWRCRDGELDLVLRSGRTLVICEVKTRSSGAFGTPAEAVTRAKQAKLRLLARHYLDTAPFRPTTVRFDVAAILAGQLEIIEAAF